MLGSASPNSVYYIRPKADRPSSGKTHKLVLTTTSLRNVVLANASDVLYYEVVTPRWERHLTRVSRLDVNTRCFDPVAEILNGSPTVHSNEIDLHASGKQDNAVGVGTEGKNEEDAKRAVAVRFYGMGELRPVEEFLQTNVDKDGMKKKHLEVLRAWFRSKDGHKYTWHADKKRLELMRDDAPDKPVAAFYKERRYLHVLRMSQHPYLEIHASVLDCLDYVIVSFLLVERLRREIGLG